MNASIECNNIGVSFIRVGRLGDALEMFKCAAQLMYPVSRCFSSQCGWPPHQRPVPLHPSSVPPCQCHVSFQEESTNSSFAHSTSFGDKVCILPQLPLENGAIDYQSENVFMCTKSFLIDKVIDEPWSCTLESAIIVYNMGLTYHLSGQHIGLQKALCLFDLSFSLAFSGGAGLVATQVAMASLNNAGQIHHSLCNYVISRLYLDSLSNYIAVLPPPTTEEIDMERNHFLMNVVLLDQPLVASAA